MRGLFPPARLLGVWKTLPGLEESLISGNPTRARDAESRVLVLPIWHANSRF